MKKIISILLTASMLAGSAATPFTAIAAETVTTASQTSEAAKTGTLTVTVYNEDEGGLYTDEHISFMICGSPDQPGGPEMGGATFLCDVTPSESNPFVLNDIDIVDNFKYTIVDSVSQDHDGYNYYIDHERSDKTFRFTENPNQDLSIYMKKNYFIVHSDTSITKDKYGEENIKNINEVDWLLRDLINSDSFKVRDMAKRQYLAKSMLMSLCEYKMIADWSFDETENVMSFTYNCGITGQLRPAIFEDEHKQLENVNLEDAAAVLRATIVGIRDHRVIVKPVRGSYESWAVGRELAVSESAFSKNDIIPTPGMKIEITNNKGYLDSSPAQLVNVLKIRILSEDAGLIKGDANCDEQVDMADVVLIMQAMANPNIYGGIAPYYYGITELGKLNGDMNGDGLTVGDAQAIQRILLGLDEKSSDLEALRKQLSDFFIEEKIDYTVIPKDKMPEQFTDKYVFIKVNAADTSYTARYGAFLKKKNIDSSLIKSIPYSINSDTELNKIRELLYCYILENNISASVDPTNEEEDLKNKTVLVKYADSTETRSKFEAFLKEKNIDLNLVEFFAVE